MTPFYLDSGAYKVAAIFQPALNVPTGTSVLFVPPFGWDDQVSYRSRRDWSLSLAASGISSLRIDLPGTGDSSGFGNDTHIVDAWAAAVVDGVAWLRSAGAHRVAVIAIGFGGLITARAASLGMAVEDLVLWGVPNRGSELLRELKAFGGLERWKTGERPEDIPDGHLRAGGYGLTADAQAVLSSIDVADLLCSNSPPQRALVLGRDGIEKGAQTGVALREAGVEVQMDAGHGWGAMLAGFPSVPPERIFRLVNAWLAERPVSNGKALNPPSLMDTAVMGAPGHRIRDRAIVFNVGAKQLYAVVTEPVDVPIVGLTVILFNAGGHRRIGPSRMWTDAARRWASLGVPVIRVDLEGIGDADGDPSRYRDVTAFYQSALVFQAKAVLELAVSIGLPQRFLAGGICSGAFWAFQAALSDPRITDIVAINPRLLVFDQGAEGRRVIRRVGRLFGPEGMKRLIHAERKSQQFHEVITYVLTTPMRALKVVSAAPRNLLESHLRALRDRGQRLHIAFCEDEPLEQELLATPGVATMLSTDVISQKLPFASHTLKPLRAQQAAHAMLDAIVDEAIAAVSPNIARPKQRGKAVMHSRAAMLVAHDGQTQPGNPGPLPIPADGKKRAGSDSSAFDLLSSAPS